MNDLRKAAEMALEALENAPIEYDFHGNPMDADFGKQLDTAVEALRQTLAQTEQEPVAYLDEGLGAFYWANDYEKDVGFTPLYTTPPKREWVGLTNEEKHQLNDALNLQGRFPIIEAIEAKLKEKNGD